VVAVAQIHQHLGYVNGPTLSERATGEDRPSEAGRLLRVRALQVDARRSLVSGHQHVHAVVLLAQVRLCRLRAEALVWRRDPEIAGQSLVERPGSLQESSAIGTHEFRRPGDLKWLGRQAHDVVVAHEGLDSIDLGTI